VTKGSGCIDATAKCT